MASGWDKYVQVKNAMDNDSKLLDMIARALGDYELQNLMEDVCVANGIDLEDEDYE